jgi:hypothetical protein
MPKETKSQTSYFENVFHKLSVRSNTVITVVIFIIDTYENVTIFQFHGSMFRDWPGDLNMNRVRSPNAGIMGSNPTKDMDVCLRLLCVVLCVGSGLATG